MCQRGLAVYNSALLFRVCDMVKPVSEMQPVVMAPRRKRSRMTTI